MVAGFQLSVKKLLVELGEAKEEVTRLKEGSVSNVAIFLRLWMNWKKNCVKVPLNWMAEKENNSIELAKRELEFANTIKILEEAEIAQAVLEQAADGKFPLLHLLAKWKMTWQLLNRIRLLSDQLLKNKPKQLKVMRVCKGLNWQKTRKSSIK